MTRQRKPTTSTPDQTKCSHNWRIETAAGQQFKALICINCGATKRHHRKHNHYGRINLSRLSGF